MSFCCWLSQLFPRSLWQLWPLDGSRLNVASKWQLMSTEWNLNIFHSDVLNHYQIRRKFLVLFLISILFKWIRFLIQMFVSYYYCEFTISNGISEWFIELTSSTSKPEDWYPSVHSPECVPLSFILLEHCIVTICHVIKMLLKCYGTLHKQREVHAGALLMSFNKDWFSFGHVSYWLELMPSYAKLVKLVSI